MLTTISEIKAANLAAGQHFFSPSAMAFFDSQIGTKTWTCPDGTVLFTTSERGPSEVRLYTVRRFHPDTGEITDASEFQAFDSSQKARAYAASICYERTPTQ